MSSTRTAIVKVLLKADTSVGENTELIVTSARVLQQELRKGEDDGVLCFPEYALGRSPQCRAALEKKLRDLHGALQKMAPDVVAVVGTALVATKLDKGNRKNVIELLGKSKKERIAGAGEGIDILNARIKSIEERRCESFVQNVMYILHPRDGLLTYAKRSDFYEVPLDFQSTCVFVPGDQLGKVTLPHTKTTCLLEVCYDHFLGLAAHEKDVLNFDAKCHIIVSNWVLLDQAGQQDMYLLNRKSNFFAPYILHASTQPIWKGVHVHGCFSRSEVMDGQPAPYGHASSLGYAEVPHKESYLNFIEDSDTNITILQIEVPSTNVSSPRATPAATAAVVSAVTDTKLNITGSLKLISERIVILTWVWIAKIVNWLMGWFKFH